MIKDTIEENEDLLPEKEMRQPQFREQDEDTLYERWRDDNLENLIIDIKGFIKKTIERKGTYYTNKKEKTISDMIFILETEQKG